MENDESAGQKEREAAHNQESAKAATPFPNSQPDNSSTEAEKQYRNEQQWKIRREWLTIAGLFLAASAAIYQGFILSKQADALLAQLGEMKSAKVQTDKLITSNADLAAAAKVQALAQQQSASTAHDALIVSQRARISPGDASLDPLQSGQSVKAKITYSNVGHEPTPLDITLSLKTWPTFAWNHGVATAELSAYRDTCLASRAVEGRLVAYPTTGFGSGYTITTISTDNAIPEGKRFVVDDSITKGTTVIIADACAVYKTVNEVHHTVMCFFYIANKTPTVSSINICEAGNAAD